MPSTILPPEEELCCDIMERKRDDGIDVKLMCVNLEDWYQFTLRSGGAPGSASRKGLESSK